MTMICRVAESCFWMHRYVERAENLSRLLKVNRSFLLDVPEGVADRWFPLIIVSGEQELFGEIHPPSAGDDGEIVEAYLTWEERSPVSVITSLRWARENARTTREVISLDKRFGKTLQSAQSSLQSAIRHEYGGKFFNSNLGWFVPGAIVGVLAFVLGLILQQPGDDAMASVMPGFFGSLFGCGLATYGWFLRSNPVGYTISRTIGAVLLLAGALIIAVTLLGLVTGDGYPAWRFAGLLVAVGIVTGAAMLYLLGAPTLAGARVLPRIEGFKLYLETAETNRLNLRDAPEMSEELYERYLPYAAGLGVEEPWSKAWAAHLARVAPAQEQAYRPAWYHGRSWSSNRIGSATAATVAAVSAAMASAMPAPKSSSGSSGGGFSGGGGGGGGGGGW